MSRRKFSREFKITAVRELEQGKTLAEVARAGQVDPSMVYRWYKAWEKDPQNAFHREPGVSPQSTLENDFLKRALLKLEVQRAHGGKACTPTSKKK